ncbi:MAG: hypothetical protein RLZZ501_1754 [Pseudomonadota bacterium]
MKFSPLTYPFELPPEPGRLIEVAPGISWFQMPLPFALDHINLWALDDEEGGLTLIDCGVADAVTRQLWSALLSGPLAGRPVRRLIATHFHPDHIGLAGWLAERLSVELTATQGEWLFARMLWLEDSPAYYTNQTEFYRRLGLDPATCATISRRGNSYRPRIDPIPVRFKGVEDGAVLRIGGREWRAIVTAGHSPAHLSLYCPEAGVLISGDQVLPRISPIVGVWPQQPDENPLAPFLAALTRLEALPEDTLVLPSHGLPFHGLHPRLADLAAHHGERLDRTRAALDRPATTAEVMRSLFPRAMDPSQIVFAVGETLAHLAYLVERGEVHRETAAGGVWRFSRGGA